MKKDTLVIMAAAGLALFVVAKFAKGGALSGKNTAPTVDGTSRVNAINNTALPGQAGWGWQYFTDGTSIGPDGKYYQGSTEVYNPMGILGASN